MLGKQISVMTDITVVGYDRNEKLIMWGIAKECEVLSIDIFNDIIKVYVDYIKIEDR